MAFHWPNRQHEAQSIACVVAVCVPRRDALSARSQRKSGAAAMTNRKLNLGPSPQRADRYVTEG
eukprot:7660170-Lingulodinium_polyedra.AAC.1